MSANTPETPKKARDMEVGQIERVGADGHVRFDHEDLGDEAVYLGAQSAFATEYRLTEAEADQMLSRIAAAPDGDGQDARRPVETITIGPEGTAFCKPATASTTDRGGTR